MLCKQRFAFSLFSHFVPILIWAATALWVGNVQAGAFTVYGPTKFIRHTGQPVVETVNFSPALTGSFTLKLYNGGLEDDDYDYVSSSVISLNDSSVVEPNDLNQNTEYLERQVTLQASNQLEVELRGKPNGAIYILIEGEDSIDPVITATVSPVPNDFGWNSETVTISFECTDEGSAIVSCTDPIEVTTEGTNQTYTGTAVDLAGNTTSIEVSVNIDKSLPVLTLTAPSDGITVTDAVISVTGSLSDNLGISGLLVNDSPVSWDNSGQFSTTVTLIEGENDLSVVVEDLAGNQARVTRSLIYQPNQAPVAQNQSLSGSEDQSLTIDLLATDADEDVLSYLILSTPENGILSGEGASWSYQPHSNFYGTDQFSFKVNDC